MTGKRIGQDIITADELARAIFIDYEGNKDLPPTLLGTLCEDTYYGGIVEPLFAGCANRYRAKGTEAREHLSLCRELLVRAESEDRCLVAWSEHDYGKMRPALLDAPDVLGILDRRYRNALHTAKRLYRDLHGAKPADGTLSSFAELTGYFIPPKYGTELVGNGLRLIREQLEQGRGYAELTDKATAAWRTIVQHNRHDLESMRHVLRCLHSQLPCSDLPPTYFYSEA